MWIVASTAVKYGQIFVSVTILEQQDPTFLTIKKLAFYVFIKHIK